MDAPLFPEGEVIKTTFADLPPAIHRELLQLRTRVDSWAGTYHKNWLFLLPAAALVVLAVLAWKVAGADYPWRLSNRLLLLSMVLGTVLGGAVYVLARYRDTRRWYGFLAASFGLVKVRGQRLTIYPWPMVKGVHFKQGLDATSKVLFGLLNVASLVLHPVCNDRIVVEFHGSVWAERLCGCFSVRAFWLRLRMGIQQQLDGPPLPRGKIRRRLFLSGINRRLAVVALLGASSVVLTEHVLLPLQHLHAEELSFRRLAADKEYLLERHLRYFPNGKYSKEVRRRYLPLLQKRIAAERKDLWDKIRWKTDCPDRHPLLQLLSSYKFYGGGSRLETEHQALGNSSYCTVDRWRALMLNPEANEPR